MTHRSRLTAIGIDVPADVHEVATRFWRSTLGSDHDGPAQAGYASIGRERGLDVFTQALDDGGPRIHLDIETDDVDAEVRRLEALGATRVQRARTLSKAQAWLTPEPTRSSGSPAPFTIKPQASTYRRYLWLSTHEYHSFWPGCRPQSVLE
jgi:hypothetical protein